MASIDMPLEQMRKYLPPLYREGDFETYWKSTVAEASQQPLNAELIPYDLPSKGIQCYAVRFDGYQGGRIAGWYLRPDSRDKMPGLCFYHGYSGRAPGRWISWLRRPGHLRPLPWTAAARTANRRMPPSIPKALRWAG